MDMPTAEDVKKTYEALTGFARPRPRALARLVSERKPLTYPLKSDGITPNNPRLPLVIYRSPVRLASCAIRYQRFSRCDK